jgi:hypothetical protein
MSALVHDVCCFSCDVQYNQHDKNLDAQLSFIVLSLTNGQNRALSKTNRFLMSLVNLVKVGSLDYRYVL